MRHLPISAVMTQRGVSPDPQRIAREQKGRVAEAIAAVVLMLKGYRILARRRRTPQGEIDLIAVRGRRLAFVRRKGRTRTLEDPDGGVLDEAALAPFLGTIGRERFARSFGLSTEALRAGGRELVANEGDVDAQLLVVATGLKNLAELRVGLERDADAVFGPRAKSTRRFTQASDRREAAMKTAREAEMLGTEWRELQAKVVSAVGRLEDRDGGRAVAVNPSLGAKEGRDR